MIVVTDVGELATLLSKYSVEEQVTILQRMVSCNHPSLAEGNKQKLVVCLSFFDTWLMNPGSLMIKHKLLYDCSAKR